MRLQHRGRCQTAGLQGAGGGSRHSHQRTDVGSGVGEAGEASLFSLGSGSALPGLPPTPLRYPPPLCRPTPQTPQTLTPVFNLSPPQPPLSAAGRYRRHSCPLSRPLARAEEPERAPSWVGIRLGSSHLCLIPSRALLQRRGVSQGGPAGSVSLKHHLFGCFILLLDYHSQPIPSPTPKPGKEKKWMYLEGVITAHCSKGKKES